MAAQTDIQNFYGNSTYMSLMEHLKELHPKEIQAFVLEELHIYGNSRIGMLKLGMNIVEMDESGVEIGFEAVPPTEYFGRNLGQKRYELSNHTSTLLSAGLGNTLVTVTDKKVYVDGSSGIEFEPEITTISDYYPNGAPIASRAYSIVEYRYGFNGQELENEINGDGNVLSATFWEYDTRLARRWNIDPVDKEFESSYACFAGNPILMADPNGDDASSALVSGLALATGAYIGASFRDLREWQWNEETMLGGAAIAAYGKNKIKLPALLAGGINLMSHYQAHDPDNGKEPTTTRGITGYLLVGYSSVIIGDVFKNWENLNNSWTLGLTMFSAGVLNASVANMDHKANYGNDESLSGFEQFQKFIGGALIGWMGLSSWGEANGSGDFNYFKSDKGYLFGSSEKGKMVNKMLVYGLVNLASDFAYSSHKDRKRYSYLGVFAAGTVNGYFQSQKSSSEYKENLKGKSKFDVFLDESAYGFFGLISENMISTISKGKTPFENGLNVRKVSIGNYKTIMQFFIRN